jgi:hypothetical protein
LSTSQERNKKNVATVSSSLPCLDIDSLKIQEEDILKLLPGSKTEAPPILNPQCCLDHQRTSKSHGMRIKKKGLNPTSLLNTTY